MWYSRCDMLQKGWAENFCREVGKESWRREREARYLVWRCVPQMGERLKSAALLRHGVDVYQRSESGRSASYWGCKPTTLVSTCIAKLRWRPIR